MPPTPANEEALFRAAIALGPGPARAAFLEQACSGRTGLRARMEALLAAHDKSDSFLQSEVTIQAGRQSANQRSAPEAGESVGTMIGFYKLLEKIGEGGFGEVYVAEQREPVKRRVALKIIKLGMDTKQVVARFEAERQALALMDHPNIAKVLDAGATSTGRPYFVMELVKGIPITKYCDQERLRTAERLDLFVKVCHAIQHAHQKGIIHRDIKPSNILVTLHDGVAVPKVIDFGIAKATQGELTDKTVYTQFQQFIGTPAYMSPEQAEMSGLDVDTRSDIYSLGVLLYELLTNRTPFDAKELMASGLDEMRRMIREKEPQRPSTKVATLQGEELSTTATKQSTESPKLISMLRGDLDWIVMKCLEKDRGRRYDTATGLAADINRHLNNEPVNARPPSTVYRFQKAFRRNKVLCVSAAAIFLALTIGIVISVAQTIRAVRAERAKQSLLESEQAAKQAATRAEAQALVEADHAQRSLYAANLNLAAQAWEESNLGKTRRLLASTTPAQGKDDLRGWEWRYLWGQTSGDDTAELSHFDGGVYRVGFRSGDRSVTIGLLGAASEERGSLLFDFDSSRISNRRVLGRSLMGVAAFVPDRDWIVNHFQAETNADSYLAVREIGTLKEVARLAPPSNVLRKVSFSRDGQRLAAMYSFPGGVRIWRVADWSGVTIANPIGQKAVWYGGVAFLAADDHLAIAWGDNKLAIHDSTSGAKLREFEAHREGITAIAAWPGTDIVAVGAGYVEKSIKIWHAETGEPMAELTGHQSWIPTLAFSPDGALLASSSADQTIRLWDTKTWKQTAVLRGHQDEVYCLAFSGDGKQLISGDKDGSVRLWQIPPMQRSPALRILSERVGFFVSSPDGHRAVTIPGPILWDLDTGEKLATITALAGLQYGCDFSPDGQQLLAGGLSGKVRVWDFDKNSLTEFDAGGTNRVSVSRLGTTGRLLTVHASATPDGTSRIKTWDFSTRQLLTEMEFAVANVSRADVSSTGEIALGRADGSVAILSLTNGAVRTNLPAHRRAVSGVGFTPNGRILATSGEEGVARLWDMQSLQEVAVLQGHLKSIHSLSISPDGRRLLTGAGDEEAVKIWDLDTRQELMTLAGQGSILSQLEFTHDGNKILGLNTAGQLHIWRAPPADEASKNRAR